MDIYSITQRLARPDPAEPTEPAECTEVALIWLLTLVWRMSDAGESERSEPTKLGGGEPEPECDTFDVVLGWSQLELTERDSVGVSNGFEDADELKRGPMCRGAKRICAGGGTSGPDPNMAEKVGTGSKLGGKSIFSESYVFSTGD